VAKVFDLDKDSVQGAGDPNKPLFHYFQWLSGCDEPVSWSAKSIEIRFSRQM